jgi:opacity protein-like surface antigen
MRKRIKIQNGLISICAMLVITTQADAWIYDGENYIGFNAQYGEGVINSETLTVQSLGVEIGRNFSPDWYGAFLAEYATYNITDSTAIDEKGLNGANVCAKIGYRPIESTLLYGLVGVSFQENSSGVLFGAGLRWDAFRNAGFFIEGRSQSVTSNEKNYTANYGLCGVNLFLNF